MKTLLSSLIFIVAFVSQSKCNYFNTDTLILHYIVREPKVKTESPPLLILLHGIGSNEEDLFSFSNQLPDNFLIISARAPFENSEGSYKWFDVDFSTPKRINNAEQAEKSRTILITFIDQLKTKFKFNDKQIYLCGFSQGGIMAYSVGLTRPDKIKGIIVLSGKILEEVKPKISEESKFKNFRALIIHGTLDDILTVDYARQAKVFLEKKGIVFEYKEFKIGHTITTEIIETVSSWLKEK